MYIKKFDEWNILKRKIGERNTITDVIRPREVRWVHLGINIGKEIDGKGQEFLRPCLIVDVFGKHLALVVPMSTKVKDLPGYVKGTYKEKEISFCVHQLTTISLDRILSREYKVTDTVLLKIKKEIIAFYHLL